MAAASGDEALRGPQILVRSMARAQPRGPSRAPWQYHSRSDLHSKVACWGVLFDLLRTSGLLREHVTRGQVVFGVNHPMHDFVNNKQKNLDLVLARPGEDATSSPARLFADFVDVWGIQLEPFEREALLALPPLREAPVGSVLVAMEAKACMTEHGKAGPRLYDELNSSHQIVHANSEQALAVGFVMVNAADTFVSPDRNRKLAPGEPPERTVHRQPAAAARVIEVVGRLPRRSEAAARGYDGLAIVVVDMTNDGGPVTLVDAPPAPAPGSLFHYGAMLRRVAGLYDATFRRI